MQLSAPSGKGTVTAVLGPTNTGKTHLAVERMLGHDSGMIGLPLRLLAREIYDRVVAQKGARRVALITGEEKIVPAHPDYYVCTVEAMPLDIPVSFLAIDEIQLADDPERGHVFTDRLLWARGLSETMLLGAETMRPLIKELLPQVSFVSRPRFSDLSYAGAKKLSRLPRRSAIVAFSAEAVYAIAELVRRQRGGAAVVMGALSPRTRNAQVALYQSGDVDFMVATDAIGMGLNMDVDHVAFAGLTKFDGFAVRELKPSESAQIAGRAGRYMNDGTFGTTADCAPMSAELVEQIENHRFDPVRVAQWRNARLDFASLRRLIDSLEEPASHSALTRTRPSTDLLSLKALANIDDIRARATSPAAVRRLWDVCQIPDFRKVMSEEHTRLLLSVFELLMTDAGQIPDPWLAKQVDALDRSDGDLDTLANRIAHIRTWTYVSNRPDWVSDASHWRERTRAIEDKLSDALHERLTQRFIDRRTSVLMRRMRDTDDLLAAVNHDGEVTVEGEYVGRLMGFDFVPDPRPQGIHGKALRAAAAKALNAEIAGRATELAGVADDDIHLSDTGKFWWRNAPIARLKAGAHWLEPRIELMADDTLSAERKTQIYERLDAWLTHHLAARITPVLALRQAVESKRDTLLAGLARGLGYQLIENYGLVERARVDDELTHLARDEREQLRRLGVRIGEFTLYMPKLVKPAAATVLALLWKTAHGDLSPSLPAPGRVSLPIDGARAFYAACGYRACGKRAVRVDMVERLADLVRAARHRAPTAKPVIPSVAMPVAFPLIGPVPEIDVGPAKLPAAPLRAGEFMATAAMRSLIGCNDDDLAAIFSGLGFRARDLGAAGQAWRRSTPARRARASQAKPSQVGAVAKTRAAKRPAAVTPRGDKADPHSPFAVLRNLKPRRPA